MQLGAVLAKAPEEQQLQLREYGRAVGMAFQITDDVLDLTASEQVLGKPVASDLREGKATLAVIHALEHCTPDERAKIQTVLEQRAFNGVTHQDILAILARYGSIAHANQQATRYAELAIEQLEGFPDNDFKRALLWLPKFVVAREK
jgi:octaprenyl-diphosphate synthase